ncbi:MAG: aldehyde dehydrogenase family protein [Acidobacteriota bacterium]|nr:aldehyde dehydrogenase family protein [Acidobacteriota bacterium]
MSDNQSISVQQAEAAVEAAHAAGLVLARFSQEQVDRICAAMSRVALAESSRLGAMAVEETGFGKPDDKREKNRFAAEDVWNYFKNLKTVGVVSETKDVVEIASPRGVVAGIIPSTNPTSTAIFKALIAIKSRNAIVMSPHPSAKRCIAETVRVLRETAIKEGLPPDALACLTETTLEATNALMKHRKTAVILATGGLGLVRAAYSSGKPAFGVGPGNVPVFVEKTADVNKAVADILTGTCFDNGTICASEQSVVVEAAIANQVREQFKQQGGHFLSADEADKVAKILVTPERTLNPQIVGKSAEFIANLAGISIPSGTRCLLADTGGVGREFPWSIEKLSPTLAFFVVDSIEAGAQRCLEILQFGGMGHTAGVHTRNRDAAIAYGAAMPASRIVVNSPTTHGAIGFSTGLSPSMTLGCGSWGGNVTSDNVSPIHLLDIKRVAFETKPINRQSLTVNRQPQVVNIPPAAQLQQPIKREEIAAIVDKFLRQKEIQNVPQPAATLPPKVKAETNDEQRTTSNAPKTIIHQVAKTEAKTNGAKPPTVDFVSETDVKNALEKKEKIYITAKTIITPAARDLGEPAEIFVKV